ncbi:MAG: DUF1704 domain-containing protein [Myxococcales bacterium]|nr:DUF1704 domain-containing protein [Myxococcales bacterium]
MSVAIEHLVVHAARVVQALAALAPREAAAERGRLAGELAAGRPLEPRWSYAPVRHDALRQALERADRHVEREGGLEPMALLYRARIQELALEAALCAAAGGAEVARLAEARFGPSDGAVTREASTLCERWLGEAAPPAPDAATVLASDAPDARSLVSRMRRAVGERRLPFSVLVQPELAALAATGERIIVVAAGRPVAEEDAIRTVVHEVEGHAVPRARALAAQVALLRAGTARGTDDQEGLALLFEERAGLLGARRRRQLAARHRAAEAMRAGAHFADVARMLLQDHGLTALDAVIAAERVFRGGRGDGPGLGRERVYLEALCRVRAHLAAHPDDEVVLRSGQVAVEAAPVLRGRCSVSGTKA